MDFKKSKAPKNTITRDINQLTEKVGNVYETVAIISKRANQISNAMKRELDTKLADYATPKDQFDDNFENHEQIEISRSYEVLPKATLMATQEFVDNQLIYRTGSKDDALK